MTRARLTRGAIGVAGFLIVGELVIRLWVGRTFDFPAPSAILYEAALLPVDPEFLEGSLVTMGNWGLGLLVAVGIAVPLGVLLGSLPTAEQAVRPLLEFLRPIPSVAIIPLAILLIPDDAMMKVSVIVYASLWPILINTLYGMHDVDPVAKESLRSYGFSRPAVLWWVSLPSAAPFIMTGFRLATGVALILTVSTEIVAGRGEGIGVFIYFAGIAVPARMDDILAGVVWVGLFGVLVNALLVAAERRLFRWHLARTGGGA